MRDGTSWAPRAVGEGSIWLNALLFSPFVAIFVIGLTRKHAAVPSSPIQHLDLAGGIVIAMWNYMGWDNLSTIADEVERPQTTYPLVMLGAVILVIVSYLLPVIAVAAARLDPNLWTTGSWVDAGQVLGGPILALAVAAAGMIGALGTFGSLMLSFTRLPAVMAADGYLPQAFARHHPKTGAPWVAILVCAVAWAACLPLGFFRLLILDVLLTGLEHSAGIRCADCVADSRTEPGAPLPDPGRDFSHDWHHRAANCAADSECGSKSKRASGNNKWVDDRAGTHPFGDIALLCQSGIAPQE